MKKILLFLLLMSQISDSFAQAKIENKTGNQGFATGGFKPNRQALQPVRTPQSGKAGPTHYQNSCFPGLDFTVQNYGYNKDGGFYSWGVKVKNNYKKPIQIAYKLVVGDDAPKGSGTVTYFIEPGESYTNDYGRISAIIVGNNSNNYRIEVSKACFEGQDCGKVGYLGCGMKEVIAAQAASEKSTSALSARSATNSRSDANTYSAQNQPVNNNPAGANGIFTVVDVVPQFPGGMGALGTFLGNNIVYPQKERENGIQGRVIVSFVIETDGSVSDIKIVKGVSAGLDNEALRVVGMLPKFSPGKQNGRPVRVQYNLPIAFTFSE